jgi:hypothetical protein
MTTVIVRYHAVLVSWAGIQAVNRCEITTNGPHSILKPFCMALPENLQKNMSRIDPQIRNIWKK